jgi:hypothetical protein
LLKWSSLRESLEKISSRFGDTESAFKEKNNFKPELADLGDTRYFYKVTAAYTDATLHL